MAAGRGRTDAVIAGLLFMGGLRRSEVSALRWADVADAGDGDGILVTVRRSKTNQEGETRDVRFVKDGAARAIRTLRAATSPEPADRVVPPSAEAAGIERRVTAHSGRVGLASELTSRGALPLACPRGTRWSWQCATAATNWSDAGHPSTP